MSNFPLKMNELLEVEIEKLSFGGSGIARHSGVVIFVPFSAPGDHLQIKISQIKKRHAEADIVQIIKPGNTRIQPPCAVYGVCGGCNWQHISYEAQLQYKQEIVSDFLKKLTAADHTKILPIVASPQPLHYRNRAQLKFKNKNLGFYKKNSHDIVNIEKCWILEEPLSAQIPEVRDNLLGQSLPPGELRKVELSLKGSAPTTQEEEDGFSQVNRFQNSHLIEATLALLPSKHTENSTIFDLYAGSGNFTFPLIEKSGKRRVIGVEMHPGAAKTAQNRLKIQKISPKKAEFYNADVGVFLRRFPVQSSDIVLLDPPRIGCSEEVISILADSQPERILYISCDPAALARDLDRLWTKSSQAYTLKQVQCFDMFPQTHHVETLVEIVRK